MEESTEATAQVPEKQVAENATTCPQDTPLQTEPAPAEVDATGTSEAHAEAGTDGETEAEAAVEATGEAKAEVEAEANIEVKAKTEVETKAEAEVDPLAPPPHKTTFKERWAGKRKLDTIPIAIILSLFWFTIVGGIPDLIVQPLIEPFQVTNPALYTILNYAVFIFPWIGILLGLTLPKRNRPILKTLKLGWGGNTPKYILLGAAIGFGMNAFVVLVASLVGSVTLTFDAFDVIPVVVCFFAVLIQSSAEEVCDRCYLYRKLARNYHSPLVPILTTSIVFSALHYFNPGFGIIPALDIFASGLMFALMIYYWNSFWAAALCHTCWNFTQNIIFGLPNSGQVMPLHIFTTTTEPTASFAYDPSFGVEGCILSTIIQFAVCAVIAVIGEKKRRAQLAAASTKELPQQA